MNVPDGLLFTVLGLALTQIAALTAYLFKKLLDFERLSQKVNDLEAKVDRRKQKI